MKNDCLYAAADGNTLFPVFLKLEQLQTLIVGGGTVGLEKLTAVLQNAPRAAVTLVGTTICPDIRNLAAEAYAVELFERPFLSCDLYGKDLVIIATENAEQNAAIREAAKARKILVNVADTPALCDFYLGSVVRKGNLKIAISTNGKSPTLAKRLRELFTEAIPCELEEVMQNLGRIRDGLKGDFAHKVKELNRITAGLVKKSSPPGER
ncbi:bifunctional precorrin-2 dehydrogenase/sirohydrochlorin ferrochelatase [Compostibacter hankyongensis]|uniref:precorrin-2 dehydrogenase n=1 Tax=Compostibacter hankyongensis TaxID=1007089 RepID=A0ABP8FXY6_9BACT